MYRWIVTIFGETTNKEIEKYGEQCREYSQWTSKEITKLSQAFKEEKNKHECIRKQIEWNLQLHNVLLKYVNVIYLKLCSQMQ